MRSILAMLLLLGALSAPVLADDHGDSALTATPIAADGTLVDACIEEPEDMDYFLFAAVAGRTYRILTSHQSAEMDAVAYLLASDGQTILSVAHGEDDDGARIRWTCPADGTYFAMVRHARASSGTGCYALSISLELLDDHGNTALAASPLLVGGEATPGFLETPDDIDAFLVPVDRGYDYVIELARTSGAARLELTISGDVDGPRTIVVDPAERIEIAGRETGSLFLLVSSSAGEPPIGYQIRVERTGYADDHGSEAATASSLDASAPPVVGAIEVEGDVDWFSLDVREGGDYAFVLSPDVGLSLRLALRAGDGEVVLQETSTSNGVAASLDWTAPAAGTFYLEVSALRGAGAYSLATSSTLRLEPVGRFNPSGYSLDVQARDGLAYLIVGVKGLSIVDLSEPADPREVGSNSTRGYAQAIALYESFALVANRGDGLTIIDVSDPTRPVETGYLDTPGWAQDVAVEGDVGVIADQRAGIHVIRLAPSGSATLLATHQTAGHAGAVALVNGIAYVAVGDAGLEIIDVSDPGAPHFLGSIETSGDARDVTVLGSIAYVASGYRGVRIADVSDPSAPEEVGWFGSSDEAVALHLAGRHLYVAERTGISVYSLVDPVVPERIATLDTPGEAVAVTVSDGLVLIADRQEGLRIARVLP